MVELRTVATIERKGVDPASVPPETLYLGLEHIERGGRIISYDTVGAAELASTKFEFSPDHVLFGKLRPNLGKVSRPVFSGVCSTDILPIRPGKHLDRNYLTHYLAQPVMVDFAASRTSGANLPRLSPTALAAFLIPLPPLHEQQRIAAILDRADAIRAKRREALAMLDELEQSIFLSMFGHDREMRPVASLCEAIVDCVNRTAPTLDGITPYKMLRTTNVRGGTVNTTNVRYVSQGVFEKWNRRLTPRPGDVLLTREAPVGEAGVLRSEDRVFLGQRLMLYRVDPTQMTAEYLAACFRSPILQAQFDRLGSGSTVKHLPLPACRNFEIPVAPLAEQMRYSDRVSSIEALRSGHLRARQAADELFASLQARAFRGEL